MIRIRRGREPAALPPIRQRELKKLRAVLRTNPRAALTLPDTYSKVKRKLWHAQHHKCCYCEFPEQLDKNDVEHFRPKARANRLPGSKQVQGYWWLAWTWRNLLFACAACNQKHKGTRFPLSAGSKVLSMGQQPPGRERPLLIDPASEDPLHHIHFQPYMKHGREHWRPNPRGGSARGLHTITVLGLDRPALLDLYRTHVDKEIRPRTNALRATMRAANPAQVQQRWQELTHILLDPRHPFTALSHDALDHLVPAAERQRWGLALSIPGARVRA
jgi:uncharacterized protein (TIGR02646 family)